MSGILRRNDLDRALYWLGNTLGLPPGMGDVFFVAPADSAYNTWFKKMGVDNHHLLTTPALAYAATTAARNDIVAVAPGTYAVTANLAWAKDNTHLVGLAGPNSRGGMGTGVCINTSTAAVDSVIEVTGDNVQFHNVQTRNVGAANTNLSSLKLSTGVNFYAEGCHFSAQGAATQVDTATACALWFYTATAGKPWGARFKNCKIGDAGELVRTAGPVVYFSGGAAGTAKYIEFIDCVIEGWCETAGIPAVEFAANYCIDRYVLFKNTLFFNYYVNNAANLTEVFKNGCGTTFSCLLFNCMYKGYAACNTTGLNYFWGDAALPAATGGLACALT